MTNSKFDISQKLTELQGLLDLCHKDIAQQRGAFQLASDSEAGLFKRPSGVIEPKRMEKFVFENYDVFLLRGYTGLFKHVLESIDEEFTQTLSRTLYELGIKKIDVYFSGVLTEKELQVLSLSLTLSDLALIGNTNLSNFVTLFEEQKSLFDDKALKHFQSIRDQITPKTTRISVASFKAARRYRDRLIDTYWQKVDILGFLNRTGWESLYAMWSETLHGNPFLIEQLFWHEKERNRNRIMAILWSTGQNVLQRITPHIRDGELRQTAEVFAEINQLVWERLGSVWQSAGAVK